MQIESAKDPVWANAEHTAINLTVKFVEFAEELPFTAALYDVEEYGAVIFARAQAGEFGEVVEPG